MDEQRRKRVWKPKVKTGCVTCKSRRIKCDEAKPVCKRCSSTGRHCEGYDAVSSASLSLNKQPFTLHGLSNSRIPSRKERDSLNFFYTETLPELAGYFESTFWQRDLPLAATHHISLRNAVVGLGALHRKFVDLRKNVLPSQTHDKQVNFALQYCNRAIRELIQAGSTDVVMTMTFCLLFHCFAWLQGHFPIALNHLRGGLRILREVDAGIIQVKRSNLHPISFESLRLIFVNLDMQVRAMMTEVQLPFWEPKPKFATEDVPMYFTSFEDARTYIEEAFSQICGHLLLMDMGPKMELDISQAEVRRLVRHYEKGDQLLTEFLARPSTQLDERQRKSLLILKMCRDQVEIFTQVYLEGKKTTEMAWDSARELFRQMLDSATQVLEGSATLGLGDEDNFAQLDEERIDIGGPSSLPSPPSSTGFSPGPDRPDRPILTFSMGLVSSLWTVAFRCRDPAIRRNAIQLLTEHPRREGFWDGTMVVKLAQQVLDMEEKACMADATLNEGNPLWLVEDAADIPDRHRVASVMVNYTGLRSAAIRYTTMTDRKLKRPGVVIPLTW